MTVAPNQAKGAPDHPHRGFETVTYMLSGEMEHKDSQGHSGKLSAGDVQWMTAGAGVIHSEMPSAGFQRLGGTLHGFQLWVNLPQRDKMAKPRYQEIPSSQIPKAISADGLARYGPFVMNTEEEIRQAIEDYRLGRMGVINS